MFFEVLRSDMVMHGDSVVSTSVLRPFLSTCVKEEGREELMKGEKEGKWEWGQ